MSIAPFLRKLSAHDVVSPAEVEALTDALHEEREVPIRTQLAREGEELHCSTLLLAGMVCRYKDLRDGGRQISALHVAGDFVDLHSFSLKRLDHNIMTMTPCRVALMPHARLKEITERHPHLTRLLWFLTNLDAALHREWELSLGRRDAPARTAHLLCELLARLEVVGLADSSGYELKLTQPDLAECLGLTAVHVNRTLRFLREQGLAEMRAGRVRILDRPGLERLAEFRANYLYLVRREH